MILSVFLWDLQYRNIPKFSDRYARANSPAPDQTAPRGAVWSGSALFAIPSAPFGLITQILEWLQQMFWVSEYLGNLQYYQEVDWYICEEIGIALTLMFLK